MTNHAKLAASNSHRWINCPGCVALAASLPASTTSIFAKEGTVAHKIISDYFSKKIGVNSWSAIDGIPITDEMKKSINTCIAFCEQLLYSQKGAQLYSEQKVCLKSIDKEMFGTADIIIDVPFDNLTVIDYKHGSGVEVFVENNSQLAYYALGALEKLGTNYDFMDLIIVQPRLRPGKLKIKKWHIADVPAFIEHWTEIFTTARLKVEMFPSKYIAGSHCQFCGGTAICPALYKKTLELAQKEFDTLDTLAAFPAPESLELQRLAQILQSANSIRKYLSAVESLAIQMLQSGAAIPRYKLVARRQNRKWRDENNVLQYLEKIGLKDIFESRKLKSPHQIEQMVSDKKTIEGLQMYLADTNTNNTTIAHESDGREAVNPLSDFDIFNLNIF